MLTFTYWIAYCSLKGVSQLLGAVASGQEVITHVITHVIWRYLFQSEPRAWNAWLKQHSMHIRPYLLLARYYAKVI